MPNRLKLTHSDRLLLYFAGHGIARNSNTGPEGYLIPQDGDINHPETLLRMGDLHDWLSQLQCRHLLTILDCCFAGTFRWASTRKLIPIPEEIHWEHYYRFIKYPAWQVITSAAHNQEALDFLNNRDGETTGKHSPFAQGLIKALGDYQGDLSQDGIITTPELYLYLRDYVEINSQERQTPGFFPLKNHDRGEYIFKLPNIEPNLTPAPKLEKDNNPYRGLESFEARHSRFFFGRQEVIQDLVKQVTQQRFTVVLGISGSGKSSLVKAGLITYLQQQQGEKWQILEPIRPGTNPYNSLAIVLAKFFNHSSDTTLLGTELKQHSPQLISSIQTWSKQNPNSRLLLIIDQLEELTTLAPKTLPVQEKPRLTWWQKFQWQWGLILSWVKQLNSMADGEIFSFNSSDKIDLTSKMSHAHPREENNQEWEKFIVLLTNILQSCPQLTLVVTLRSDFETRFLDSALQPYWSKARFIVRPMRTDELRDAIEKPAGEMALYFEPANLVDRLVDEVAQMPGALPLLSFTLSEMYINLHRAWLEVGKEDRALTVAEDFEQQGGVAGSLTRRANAEYHNLPDDKHRKTMRQVMLRMVEIEGGEAVRRRVPKTELEYPEAPENGRVAKVLQCLDQARLIVGGEEAGIAYVEPAHDFLVRGWDKLQDWLQVAQHRDNIALQGSLTTAAFTWQQAQKSNRFLWNANPYLEVLQNILHSATNWFNRVETEFVQRSIARKKFNVRSRRIFGITVIMALSILYTNSLREERNAKINDSNASKESARLNLSSRQALEGMIYSLKSGKILQTPLLRLFKLPNQLQEEVTGTLQWSVYQVKELNRMQGDTVPVRSQFNSQGDLLASAEENGMTRLWDLQGKELAAWKADPKRAWGVSFSPNQDLLASAAESGRITLWNLQGQKLADWQGHPGQVRDVSFSADGEILASAGGEDGTVKLWNLQGKELRQWRAHKAPTKNVDFSPDGQLIVTTGGDKTIRVWNLEGYLLQEFPIHSWRVVFSPDGKYIANAGDDGRIHLWNREYELLESWQADNQRLWNITFSPDSKYIASSGEDGSARIWDLQGKQVLEFNGHNGPARSVSFREDGKVLASAGDDGNTRLWNLENRQLRQWQGDNNWVHSVVFAAIPSLAKGDIIVSGGDDGIVRLWNSQGEKLLELPPHNAPVKTISISSNGKWLVSADATGIIHLWNFPEKSLQKFPTNLSPIESMVFSPDDRVIAVAGGEGKIQLWDLRGNFVSKLSGHTDLVNSLSFSPDGKLLASASKDGTVITWDWQDQKQVSIFQDHIGEVFTVAFSPSGDWIASGGQDGTIRLWNLKDNSTQSPFHIYNSQVKAIAFSPDGKRLFSSDNRGYIQLWDIASREILATWQSGRASIETISLNSAGNILATAGESGKVKLWRIDSFDELMSQVCSLMANYLKHNSTLQQGDRTLCNGIADF